VASGWLAAVLAGVGAVGGAGIGGLVGAPTSVDVSQADAELYAEGVRRGGTVVTARVPEQDARRVASVMDRPAVDIRKRKAEYRQSGWRAFDPNAAPYTADQVRSERELHRAA
jgi:hypothetical protein